MKNKEDNITLKVKSWDDCSIQKYYEMQSIAKDKEIQPYAKEISLLAIMCDCDEEDIWNMDLKEFRNLQRSIGWINDEIKVDTNARIPNKIEIYGKRFRIETDLTKFTVAQYIDFQSLWSRRNDLEHIFGNVLACFIIPENKKYGSGYDINELANDLMKSLSISKAFEILSFFFVSWLNSTRDSLLCWKQKMMKTLKPKTKEEESQLEKLMQPIARNILDGLVSLTQFTDLQETLGM